MAYAIINAFGVSGQRDQFFQVRTFDVTPGKKKHMTPAIVNDQDARDRDSRGGVIQVAYGSNPEDSYREVITYGPKHKEYIIDFMGETYYGGKAQVNAFGTIIKGSVGSILIDLPSAKEHLQVMEALRYSTGVDRIGVMYGHKAAVDDAVKKGAPLLQAELWAGQLAHKFGPTFDRSGHAVNHRPTSLDDKIRNALASAIHAHEKNQSPEQFLQEMGNIVSNFEANITKDERNEYQRSYLTGGGVINTNIDAILDELQADLEADLTAEELSNGPQAAASRKWPADKIAFFKAAVKLESDMKHYNTLDKHELNILAPVAHDMFNRLSELTLLGNDRMPSPSLGAKYFDAVAKHLGEELAKAKLVGASLRMLGEDIKQAAKLYPAEMVHQALNAGGGLKEVEYATGIDQKLRTFDDGFHVALRDFYNQSRVELVHLQNGIKPAMDIAHSLASQEMLNKVIGIVASFASFGLGLGSMAGAGLSLAADLQKLYAKDLAGNPYLTQKGYAEWIKADTGLASFGTAISVDGATLVTTLKSPENPSGATLSRAFDREGLVQHDEFGLSNLVSVPGGAAALKAAELAENQTAGAVQLWSKAAGALALSIGQGYGGDHAFGWTSKGSVQMGLSNNGETGFMADRLKAGAKILWNDQPAFAEKLSNEWLNAVQHLGYDQFGRVYVNIHTEMHQGKMALAGVGVDFFNNGHGSTGLEITDAYIFI